MTPAQQYRQIMRRLSAGVEAEAELGKVLPPGNAGCQATIAGVPVRRYAAHYDVAGEKAFCFTDAVALIEKHAA